MRSGAAKRRREEVRELAFGRGVEAHARCQERVRKGFRGNLNITKQNTKNEVEEERMVA